MPPRDTTRYAGYKSQYFESLSDFQRADNLNEFITINYNGSPFDILNINRGHATTIVSFHASLSPRVETIPAFAGLSIMDDLPANLLFISDPTLELDKDLRLSWFAGNSVQRLQRDLPSVLNKVLDLHGANNVIFFGASGGGFAALYYSAFFPDSLAIPLNPQVVIRTFPDEAVLAYGKTAFSASTIEQARMRLIEEVTDDVRHVYRGGISNTIAYVQNYMDTHHLYRHLKHFLEALPKSDRFNLLVDDWGLGHIAPPRELIRAILEETVNCDGKWADALNRMGFIKSPDPGYAVHVREMNQPSH